MLSTFYLPKIKSARIRQPHLQYLYNYYQGLREISDRVQKSKETMTTDQRLDNVDSLLRTLVESVTRASQNIEQLVMTTQLLEQAVANVFNGMTELRADINVDLKAELIEIKEAAKLQAATADKQAENVRLLIQMLNQRLA
jgi:hypothetical protein